MRRLIDRKEGFEKTGLCRVSQSRSLFSKRDTLLGTVLRTLIATGQEKSRVKKLPRTITRGLGDEIESFVLVAGTD